MIVLPMSPTTNAKLVGSTGAQMFATYREVGATCPTTCALLNAGCYAQGGNVAMHARRGSYDASDGARFGAWVDTLPIGAVVRLHVSGDVMRPTADGTEVDADYLDALINAAHARPDVTIYGYTHAWRAIDRARFAMPGNLTLNASCDSPADVAEARAAGWDTTTVVPSDTSYRRDGDTVVCPEQTSGIPCVECGLCMRARPVTVAFKAHGSGTRKVDRRLS